MRRDLRRPRQEGPPLGFRDNGRGAPIPLRSASIPLGSAEDGAGRSQTEQDDPSLVLMNVLHAHKLQSEPHGDHHPLEIEPRSLI